MSAPSVVYRAPPGRRARGSVRGFPGVQGARLPPTRPRERISERERRGRTWRIKSPVATPSPRLRPRGSARRATDVHLPPLLRSTPRSPTVVWCAWRRRTSSRSFSPRRRCASVPVRLRRRARLATVARREQTLAGKNLIVARSFRRGVSLLLPHPRRRALTDLSLSLSLSPHLPPPPLRCSATARR